MEQYSVRITDEALEDMECIFRYISDSLQSPINARRQYDRIAAAILSLEYLPERIRLMDEDPWHSLGMRRLNVDNYSVFYVIRDNTVFVADVLYGASDIENRLRTFGIG